MAQQFSASIYGKNQYATGTAQGQTMSFPSQGVRIYPATADKIFNTVTALSVIELLPSSTKVGNDKFYAIATVATLVTAANA